MNFSTFVDILLKKTLPEKSMKNISVFQSLIKDMLVIKVQAYALFKEI